MKRNWIGLVLLLGVTGCRQLGQGTPGSTDSPTATGRDNGPTSYALGHANPAQQGGMADMTIAASRAEASLDVSGAGMAELSRRSAAATLENSGTAVAPTPPPASASSDDSLLERVRRALQSPEDQAAGSSTSTLSAQAPQDVRVAVRNGAVTLDGTVPSAEDKAAIETTVRGLPGVGEVNNRLEIRPRR